MSRLELYSPEGIRVDGRRFNELRQFECQINTHTNANCDGSSYVQQGNTKVICLVRAPYEDNDSSGTGSVRLNVNINLTPFAQMERKKKRNNDRRLQELSIILRRCFLKTIVVKNYNNSTIDIDLTILQLDGGLLSSCCNAITLGLINAGIALYDYISSVTIGIYDQTPLLDLNSLEESDLSFITIGSIGDSDKLNLMLLEDKIPLDRLESLLALGIEGCHRIKHLMDEQIRSIAADVLNKRQ